MNNETDCCQEVRVSPQQQRIKCETALKVQIVEQLLRGKSLDTVARETGRSKKQLSFWYRRFLTGGEAYLSSREDLSEISKLRQLNQALLTKAEDLEKRNRELVKALEASTTGALPRLWRTPSVHEHYAKAFESTGSRGFPGSRMANSCTSKDRSQPSAEFNTQQVFRDIRHSTRTVILRADLSG